MKGITRSRVMASPLTTPTTPPVSTPAPTATGGDRWGVLVEDDALRGATLSAAFSFFVEPAAVPAR